MASQRYTRAAALLHWLIAALIVMQLASGLWMVRAIETPERFMTAVTIYQLHKSVGLCVLVLSCVRVIWRLTHAPPPLGEAVSPAARRLARVVHAGLYVLMLAVPLAGWAMVSASPLGISTTVFGWLPWPHLPLAPAHEVAAKTLHRALAYALAVLAVGHVAAALLHARGGTGFLARMSLSKPR